MKQKIIKVKNLTKKFHDHLVLKNINLDLYENESLAIIGKSGSGKSVLLKCLIGLINPDQGSIKDDALDRLLRGLQDNLATLGVCFSVLLAVLDGHPGPHRATAMGCKIDLGCDKRHIEKNGFSSADVRLHCVRQRTQKATKR